MYKDNTVVDLFPKSENVIPHPSAPIPRYVGIDYDQLACAILDQQQKREEEKKAALHAASSIKKRETRKNGTVDPIKDKKDIARIAEYFYQKSQYRNELLFLIGCSVGLRGSDLVDIKVGDFAAPNYQARIKEQKTGKYRTVTLNPMAIQAYQALVDSMPGCTKDSYLFQSQRKGNHNIQRHSFARILREAQHDLNLPYRLGTHSMRKTFAYHIFMDNQQTPEVLAYLQHILNHRDSATTLRYIGLDAEKMSRFYQELDFGFSLNDISK